MEEECISRDIKEDRISELVRRELNRIADNLNQNNFQKGEEVQSYNVSKEYLEECIAKLRSEIIDQCRELDENYIEYQDRSTGSINKNIVDTAHKLYIDICSENYKIQQRLIKRINIYRNLCILLCTIIVSLVIILG